MLAPMSALNLSPGEQIIFEGHPSWRATLAFYVQGVLAVLVVGVIALLVSSTGVGAGVIAAGIALVVLIGFIKRVATVYTITDPRHFLQAHPADAHRPRPEREHRAGRA